MAFAGLGNMHHLEDHPSPDFVSLLADAVEGVQSEDSDWPLHFQQPAHARQAAHPAHPAGNLSQQPFAAPLQPQAPAYNPLSLQGDEHTWQLNDWDWDAHSLSASLKNAPPTSRGDAQIQPNKLNPYSFNGGQALHQPNPAQAHPASACCDAAGAACSFHLPTPTLTSGHATGHPAQAGLQSTSCQQPWGHSTDGANWTFPDPDPSLVGSGPQQEPWRHVAGYTAQHQHNGMAPGMPMDQQMQHVMQGSNSMQHGHMAAPNGHACCMRPSDMHQAGPHGNHQHALQMGGTHSNAVNAPPPPTLHSPHVLPTSPWSRGSPASSSRHLASAPVPAPPPAQMHASSVSSKLMHHAAQQVIAGMPSNAHHQSAAAAAPRNDGMAEDGDDGWCSDGMEDSIRQQPQKKAKQSTQAELDAAIASGVITITDKPESEKMVCQVACCGKDLTNLKEYHQRYRICEVHIKLPAVIKDNCLQRFCQQCGRFHELSAFEGSRKSCRDQLSKHNARRRRRAQIEQLKVRSAASEAGIKPEVALASAVAASGGAVLAPGGAGDQPPGGRAPQPPGGAGGAPAAAGAEPGDISRLLSALTHNPQQLHALRLLLGVSTNAALPPLKPYSPKNCPVCDGDGACPTDSAHAASVEPASHSLARDILQGRNEFSPEYDSEHRSLRISMKLFNKTPADLPPDLKQQVCSWLDAAPTGMEGYIRPGCVYLTLQMLVTKEVYRAAMAAGLQSLLHHLQHSTGCDFWWSGVYCVQLFGQVAVLMNGQVGTCVEYVEPGMVPPAAASLDVQQQQPLLQQAPIVAKPSVLCIVGDRPEGFALGLTGEGLDTAGLELVCRYKGRQFCTQLLHSAAGKAASTCIPHLPGCGVAVLECCKGAYASPPRLLLVVDDPALAAEVQQLAAYMVPAAAEGARVEQEGARAGCRLSQEQVDAVLVDLGLVLQHLQGNEKPGLPLEALCLKARRLLAFACDMNWHRTVQRVLPLAVARCGTAPQAVDAVHRASAAARDGLSLLHRAVRSGNLALVSGMLHWGQQHGYAWRADHSGPGGLTPLHLAALLDDARIAVLLLDHCPREAFTRLVTHDGVTPFHLAFQMGHYDVPTLMRALHCIKVTKADGVLLQKHGRGSRASKLQKSGSRQQGQLAEVKCEPVDEVEGLDPCEHCHSTMPPLVLDVKAACTDCGEPQPCISEEEAKGNPAGASDSDADWGLPATPGKRPRDSAMGHASTARHRATHHSELGRQPGLAALPHAVLDACVHSHGNVYCVTAMCQSCHTNRMLEVA